MNKYKNILKNWDKLMEAQSKDWGSPARDPKTMNLVLWVAVHDTADSYEVDEEWVGITKDGQLYWAYASGCSCWDGDYGTEPIKDIKSFAFDHKEIAPKEWLDALKKFDEDLQVVRLTTPRDWDKRHG